MPILYQVLAWLGVLLAGGTGGYLVTHPEALNRGAAEGVVWIEVTHEGVSSDAITVKDEDVISPGATVATDAQGTALLHFPDGSTVEMEPLTTMTIRESTYDSTQQGIVAKVFLTAGRLAFKITKLATPESLWEVKTGNAVAVVRGTAFTVWFEDDTSAISVTENTVSVATLDPETGEPIPQTEVLVTEEKTAKVTDKDAASGKAPTVKTTTPADMDKEIPETSPVSDPTTPTSAPPKTQPPTTSKPPAVVARELAIEGTTRGAVEGDEIMFTAVVHLSDGSKRDVTKEASWQVLGPIGTIRSNGVFVADLSESTSEYGKGSGAVVATWKNPITNTELLGKTAIFEVQAYVSDTLRQEGQ